MASLDPESRVTNESQVSLEEADDIVQDALQLAEHDELNEYRDVLSDVEADAKSAKGASKAASESKEEGKKKLANGADVNGESGGGDCKAAVGSGSGSQEPVKEAKEADSKGSRDSDRDKGKAAAASASTSTAGEKSDAPERNVWVSGLSQSTRASDLQSVFKTCGKVVGAKIIKNTRIPGSRYYGLITMETKEQAEKCIQTLNKTELNGKTIIVEKNRPKESSSYSSAKDSKESGGDKSRRERDSEREKNKSKGRTRERSRERDTKDTKNRDKDRVKGRNEKTSRKSKSPAKKERKRSPVRRNRSRSPVRGRVPPVRSPRVLPVKRPFIPHEPRINPAELRRIEAERLARRRERMLHDSLEQRRQDEDRRQRELIQIEAEKLRRERELLEKEKAELLRLERERARLEREKIEREKEEILRKVAHERDFARSRAPASSPQPLKRSYDTREHDSYWDSERKRQVLPDPLAPAARMTFDAPSAARFEFDARGAAAPAVNQDRFPVRSSNDYSMDSRRDASRPDRDDRSRALATASVANPGFYRSDLRDSRADARLDTRRPPAPATRVDDGWKSESRRDRPPPTVSSMISVSGSAVGPQGMYSSTGGAPLGPIMSHSSLSSTAPIGAAQLDSRSYVHSMRRFPS